MVTPPSSASKRPSAADFFRMVPPSSLKSIGNFSSVIGLAVTSWSSVLYINTGTGVHAFMLDGTPLWSTLVQFNGSVMKSPKSMGVCADNVTDCAFFPSLAVDQCDGSIYVSVNDSGCNSSLLKLNISTSFSYVRETCECLISSCCILLRWHGQMDGSIHTQHGNLS